MFADLEDYRAMEIIFILVLLGMIELFLKLTTKKKDKFWK